MMTGDMHIHLPSLFLFDAAPLSFSLSHPLYNLIGSSVSDHLSLPKLTGPVSAALQEDKQQDKREHACVCVCDCVNKCENILRCQIRLIYNFLSVCTTFLCSWWWVHHCQKSCGKQCVCFDRITLRQAFTT